MNSCTTKTIESFGGLTKNELFRGLQGPSLEYALDFWEAVPGTYRKGEFLHRPGSRLSHFGLVLSGRVQVYMDDLAGNPIIMANVTEGKTFGEALCFLGVEEEPVTIMAVTDVKVLWLKTDTLRQEGKAADGQAHEMVLRFIGLVTERTLAMNDRIQVLSQSTLRGKLIVFFSQCAHQYGSDCFSLPFNRNEMAAYLGTNRSALSRELSKMQEEGILRFSREKFQILKRS